MVIFYGWFGYLEVFLLCGLLARRYSTGRTMEILNGNEGILNGGERYHEVGGTD